MRVSRFWGGAETLVFMAFAFVVCGAELLTRMPTARAGLPRPIAVGEAAPAVQATIYSADFYCRPCDQYVADVCRELPPDGWRVCRPGDKHADQAHVLITKQINPADKINAYPTTIIRKNGVEVDRLVGRHTPTVLVNAINNQLKVP